MKFHFIIIGLLVVIIFSIIIYICVHSKSNSNSYSNSIKSKEYRTDICNNAPKQYKNNLNYLYSKLDSLDYIINDKHSKLDTQSYDIAKSVLDKANSAEREIRNYWESNKVKADFYFYIGLHYTSFTLADKLTEELNSIKSYINTLSGMINSIQNDIDKLKNKIERSGGTDYISKKEHKDLCVKCHALRNVRKECIIQRNNIKKRRDDQNIITAKRRDYIGNHFGSKGKQWKKKIMSKHHNHGMF